MVWKCIICAFSALVLDLLLSHYNSQHVNEPQFQVSCGIDFCRNTYTKANSFAVHVRRKHIAYMYCTSEEVPGRPCQPISEVEPSGYQCSPAPSEEDDTPAGQDLVNNLDSTSDHQHLDLCHNRESEEELQDVAIKYLVKIKQENTLSQKTVKNIAQSTCAFISATVAHLRRGIEKCLEEANIHADELPGLDCIFAETEAVCRATRRTATGNFENLLKDTTDLPYVKPLKCVLGKHRAIQKRFHKRRIIEVEDHPHYIPILQSLQQLSSPKFLQMIMDGAAQALCGDVATLTDFSSGLLFREHPLFSNDERAIQILLYYDDVNICNPLTNKPHKLCLFYYQVANLPPVYRSKLKSIKLFAVCSYKIFKKYKDIALDKIFEPLVSDLKLLGRDEGYTFTVPNMGDVTLRGAVLAFLADTPASQAVGGFKESVGGARRKCRHCMATFETMQEYFEEMFTLRDIENHEAQLCNIEKSPSMYLKQYFCKEYGINRRSILSELPYFDVCEQLPQDIMHVFLEGILQYEIKLLLNYFISDQHALTIDQLNSAIQNFQLGYADVKNRPILIQQTDLELRSSTNLGQTASRMWLLSQILPFILETYIDTSSPHWECLMSLLEIMAIAFCTSVTHVSILYLKNIIKKHLLQFKDLYSANIIPKQHYLVHLPSLIIKFGPLIRCWCMRFEGKHAYFKDLAKKIRNFKNLPFSLATRNQQIECADAIQVDRTNQEVNPLFKDKFSFGHYRVLQGDDAIAAKDQLSKFFGINLDITMHDILECSRVEIYGTNYKPGLNNFLLYDFDDAGLPQFGCLKQGWYIDEYGFFLAIEVVDTINYNEKFNAFQIASQGLASGYEVVSHSGLRDHHV